MGIRFYCHVCDKRLNVKGFLAGKRGVCPHCGAKVDIPWESQTREDAEESPEAVPWSVAATVPTSAPAGNGVSGHAAAGAVARGGGGSPFPAITPTRVLPMGPAPVSPAPASPASPAQAAPGPAAPMAAPVAKAIAASPITIAAPAAPAPVVAQPSDPITEAPSAVWYVRPPSGGQYGPASGEIMRKWLGEGRVSSDSLIWREGWPDWKSAASQFPQLGGGTAPAVTAGVSLSTPPHPAVHGMHGAAVSTSPSTPGRSYGRRKNNSLAVVIVVLLTLMSIALFGVLIAVLQFMR